MNLFQENLDFVGIGDILTDAFIKLKDAEVHCDINKENCKISMDFGAKIPYESVEEVKGVGNAANATVAAARLGLNSALVADVGKDKNGDDCKNSLKENHVSTKFITEHGNFPTNYHYVLWFGDDRTILVKHSEFPYKFPNVGKPKWLYLSSLANHSEDYHNQIGEYLNKNADIKLAFQPGTFQIKLGYEKLKAIYQRTEIFFCNIEEAKTILGITEHDDVKDLAIKMRELGPKIVVLTDGPKGAYAYDGNNLFFMPPYPDPKPPVDRTGAGDSFASTFTIAMALGKNIEEALRWAPINSMSVVQYVGAQKGLLTRKQLEEYLAKAPENYKVEKI